MSQKNRIGTNRLIITFDENAESIFTESLQIFLRGDDDGPVGSIVFGGTPVKGNVSVSFEIKDGYRNIGIMTEALGAVVRKVFRYDGVYSVSAVVTEDNKPALRVLEKLHFVNVSGSDYKLKKPVKKKAFLCAILGIIIGLPVGIVIASPVVGMLLCGVIAFLIGNSSDKKEKKRREQITGETEEKKK